MSSSARRTVIQYLLSAADNFCALATVLTGRLMGGEARVTPSLVSGVGGFLLEDAIFDATLVLFAHLK